MVVTVGSAKVAKTLSSAAGKGSLVLTDAKIRGFKPPERGQIEYCDAVVPGLRIRIGVSGAKSFVLRKRVAGKYRNITLGRYSERLVLAEARKRSRQILSDVEIKADPVARPPRCCEASGATRRSVCGDGAEGEHSTPICRHLGLEIPWHSVRVDRLIWVLVGLNRHENSQDENIFGKVEMRSKCMLWPTVSGNNSIGRVGAASCSAFWVRYLPCIFSAEAATLQGLRPMQTVWRHLTPNDIRTI